MPPSTKLNDKLKGIKNFHAWKYIIGLILEENDLAKFIKEVVSKPKEDEAKGKYKKDMIRAKRIIVDSIKDQLEAIGDTVEEAEIVMTTLNGLPRDWEDFI